jgi:hypothetical protein
MNIYSPGLATTLTDMASVALVVLTLEVEAILRRVVLATVLRAVVISSASGVRSASLVLGGCSGGVSSVCSVRGTDGSGSGGVCIVIMGGGVERGVGESVVVECVMCVGVGVILS